MVSTSIQRTRSCVLFLVAVAVAAFFFTATAASPSAPSQTCDSATDSNSAAAAAAGERSCSSSCSDASDLEKRVSRAINKEDRVSLTKEGRSLRATLENVLSEQECQFLVDALPPSVFLNANKGGYESTSQKYTASRIGYSGIGLNELAAAAASSTSTSKNSNNNKPMPPPVVFDSQKDYDKFLEFRERMRAATEKALNLCPGTLKIDYTHVSQKTPGGTHRPHADNCFHYYRDIHTHTFDRSSTSTSTRSGSSGSSNTRSAAAVAIDPSQTHPYSNRVAASILYLNDEGFEGGEFYWANRSSEDGAPEMIVAPKRGRATVFTSGIENLHGALPVEGKTETNKDEKQKQQPPARRLALAMWYVTDSNSEETVPEYGQPKSSTGKEEEDDPNRTVLFEIPVESIKIGSLRLALGLYLVGKQNTPTKASWRANQNNENTLHMIFGDQTAMVSITLLDARIVVSRHTDGIRAPSLRYQLQESVMLHGVLTELETLAVGTATEEQGRSTPSKAEDRLIQLEQTAIDKARSTLPTRR